MSVFPSSLPRICVALGLPTAAELNRVVDHEYRDGNTFFEFRLDYLADIEKGIELITDLRTKSPDIRILATCRHEQTSGRFTGSIERQLAILRDAASAGACALDLEIETAESAKAALSELRAAAPLLLSYHDFKKTPALGPILGRLSRIPASAYKIATTACKPSDNLRLLDFVRQQRHVPLVLLAMSELGTATRVLGPSLGCIFTYASAEQMEGTAPGQVSAKNMRSLYRCDKLTRHSRVFGVIADPVAHSKSPLIHNRSFQSRRLDAIYLPFLVPRSRLKDWMKLALELPVCGFSVTIPHKQKILQHLDIVEPLAKRIGAVNTVWRKAGKWRGANTDVQGVLNPLKRHLRLAGASVLIAGYGGAARAAAFALRDAGANVTISGRNVKRAQALARMIKGSPISLEEAEQNRYDVLVQATPIGMFPNVNDCLFRDVVPASVVLDMVYNPHETLLLRQARNQGATIIHGSEMFLEQAASQFEIWTGERAPRAVMQSALEHT